jgi:hypothetical protein
MKIIATKIKAENLNSGDLFSTEGQEYWDTVNNNEHHSIGEKVYIRTIEACPEPQKNEDIYRLTIYQYENKI